MTEADRTHQLVISRGVRGQHFFLELTERGTGPFAVAYGGREVCGDDYVVDRSTYPFPTLEFVAEGEGMVAVGGGRPQRVGPGMVFAYGPGVPVRVTGGGKPMVKYFICLTGAGAAEALVSPVRLLGAILPVARPTEVESLLELIVSEGGGLHVGAQEICRLLFDCVRLKLFQGQPSGIAPQDRNWELFLRCKHAIDRDPNRFSSLPVLLRHAGVSRALLFRLFRVHLQTTPYAYILRQRMNRAAKDLLDTKLLIKEVAARAGFDDALHFSRAFKQIHGLSPAHWRSAVYRAAQAGPGSGRG